ncbi:MBL fold metallo-hydrolase [Marinicrinis sediminis]|uniref:MBL fold metallo-hydrolase n=1 Tax=Marinicrinis sediminis TaxID=1652465 RepID=A0ABW5RD52_9BACL
MRLTRQTNLIQLTFLPYLMPVNCYLIEEEDGYTLIDTALPSCGKAILKTASKPIRRIVLTHAHSDHIGALDALKRELPDATVYISERDAKLLAGDRTLQKDEEKSPLKGGIPRPGRIQTRPDRCLQDGDRIGSLLAISVPGHTPGSMAFLDTRTRTLIAGDALQVQGGLAVSGQLKIMFPFPAFATWNKRQAVESARKLLDLEPALLAVGHGRLLPDPANAMSRAIQTAEQALSAK